MRQRDRGVPESPAQLTVRVNQPRETEQLVLDVVDALQPVDLLEQPVGVAADALADRRSTAEELLGRRRPNPGCLHCIGGLLGEVHKAGQDERELGSRFHEDGP